MGFTHIGKIIKHKGLKGHLILRITKGYKFKEINTIHIELESSKIPFSLENFSKINSTHYQIKIRDYQRRESNQKFINMKVFLRSKEVKNINDELEKILYYKLVEENIQIGFIKNYINQKQPILFCEVNKKEVLIPYVKEIIVKTDHINQKIHVKIPKGLLDLN